jgi:hypothetical protein
MARTDGERLGLFCRAVEETLRRRALTEGTISARFTINVSWDDDAELVSEGDSDEEDVRSLLMAYRKFHAPKEDVHFYRIANIVERLAATDPELLAANRTNRDSWRRLDETPSIRVVLNDHAYAPKDWFAVWVNGGLFHDDPGYAGVFDSLDNVSRAIARATVHDMVLGGVRVIHAERNLIEEGFRRGLFPPAG